MGGCSRPGISSLYGGGIEWSATPLRLAGGGGGGVTSLSASFLGLGTRLSPITSVAPALLSSAGTPAAKS